MSDLDKLRRRLERANTVAGFKALHDDAAALAKEAATARDFSLLDDCTAVRLACTRSGGILMLGGAERVPGVDDQVWERRAAMAEAQFAGAVARAVSSARNRAGAPPSSPHAARKPDDGSQSKTLISDWHHDHLGFPTRFIVGVSPARFNREVAAGADPEKVAAMLIAEALAISTGTARAKRRSAEAA